MRHTEQEGGREEEAMLAAELATGAYRKSEIMRSGHCKHCLVNLLMARDSFTGLVNPLMSRVSFTGLVNLLMSRVSFTGLVNPLMSRVSFTGLVNPLMSRDSFTGLSDMEFLEVLTEGLNRVLLVRGGGREVITIYS